MKLHNPMVQSEDELFYYLVRIIDPKFKAPDHRQEVMLHCPAHDDQKPSLSFTVKDDRAVMNCHAKNCSYKEILAACGLNESDGFLYERNGNQDNSYRSRYNLATRKEMPKSNESMNYEDDKEISLKSIDAGDTTEKQATRREWKFYELSKAELSAIEARYGIPVPVLRPLCNEGILYKWYDSEENSCWCLTDGFWHSAQAVRLDGEPFYNGSTKHNLRGTLTSYPIGWTLIVNLVKYLRINNPEYLKNQCLLLVCEGVTDYLAGWALADHFGLNIPKVLPLGILGANVKPTAEIVETLTGCNVRLAFDNDDAGEHGQCVWKDALQEKCNNLDAVDHHGKNDLRDLWDMVKPGENPTTETIEIVKGEMINA